MNKRRSIIVALDQGTTGSTAAYFDSESWSLLGNWKQEFQQIYPTPGWVEHDPEAIWQSVLIAIEKGWQVVTSQFPECTLSDIQAIGITNQRETVVAWNRRSGEVAGKAIVWQDRRTADYCDTLKADEKIRSKILTTTGLVCDPYFSASKMRWMQQNLPKVKEFAQSGDLIFGTIDSYLIYKLTAGASYATDHTNASRTMLYSLQRGSYDSELCSLFGISPDNLPTILDSADHYGVTVSVPGIPDGIRITGCIGDQQAALLGHDGIHSGEGKITYGTGTFVLVNIGEKPIHSDKGILATVAMSSKGKRSFALEGSAFIAGAAIQYIRDNLHWIKESKEVETLAMSQPRDPHVVFVPAFAGLGAPYWNAHAKAMLIGLSRGTSKAQIARAILESIALQNVQILNLMNEASGQKLQRVGIDGGAAKNAALMQFQSDVSRVVLERPKHTEMTALGAAKAAYIGTGGTIQKSAALVESRFSPSMPEPEANTIVQQWLKAADFVDSFYR